MFSPLPGQPERKGALSPHHPALSPEMVKKDKFEKSKMNEEIRKEIRTIVNEKLEELSDKVILILVSVIIFGVGFVIGKGNC